MDRRAELRASLAYYAVPDHLREGLVEYVVTGRPTGDFLRACLENNFVEAVLRAAPPISHVDQLAAIAKWIANVAPQRSWGSPGVVKTWRGETHA